MSVRAAAPWFALAAGLALATPASAADAPEPALRLTIYANGLALVDERRTLRPEGGADVHLGAVAPRMVADSVRVATDGGPALREIALDSDVLSERALLKRALGKKIKVVRTNPATGAETVETAEVLSVADGLVLRIGDRIETGVPGRLVFDELPDGLHAEPTLTLTFAEPLKDPLPARIAYLTEGLSWNAVYTAVIDASDSTLDLEGWARIGNDAGVDFAGAAVSLVAGDVARQTPPAPQGKILMRAQAMAADGAGMPERSEISAFHLYDLMGTMTVADKGTKQVRLMAADGVAARRVFDYRGGAQMFAPVSGDGDPVPVTQAVIFRNDVAAHLGVPLPAGVLRAYTADASGALRFVGEDRIVNSPIGAEVRLNLGRAFDVTVARTQTAYRKVGDRSAEATFKLAVRNGGAQPATVNLTEDIPGEWEILEESAEHARDGNAAKWTVSVPGKGTVDLTYKARSRW